MAGTATSTTDSLLAVLVAWNKAGYACAMHSQRLAW